tara:strand:+ start:58 stop:747 length:690 start_codon:yes stop_codon:yes gene_type:complete
MKIDLNISFFKFVWSVFQSLEENNNKGSNNNVPDVLAKIYREFSNESEKELFDSEEDLIKFYSEEENYKKLLTSELGDNLLRKYSAKIICSSLNETIDFSINKIFEMMSNNNVEKNEIKNVLESSRLWLKNLYIFDAIFNWEKEKNNEPTIRLEYDIPSWHKQNSNSILNFKKKINYKMTYNKRNEGIKNELITLHGSRDKIYVVGKYFHQMNINGNDIERSSIEVSAN